MCYESKVKNNKKPTNKQKQTSPPHTTNKQIKIAENPKTTNTCNTPNFHQVCKISIRRVRKNIEEDLGKCFSAFWFVKPERCNTSLKY